MAWNSKRTKKVNKTTLDVARRKESEIFPANFQKFIPNGVSAVAFRGRQEKVRCHFSSERKEGNGNIGTASGDVR